MNEFLSGIPREMDPYYMDMGHMGGSWYSGMWLAFPFMWLGMLLIWLIFLVVAAAVYRDAESRGMNGLLWAVLIIIPWLGIFALVVYLIVRESSPGLPPAQAPVSGGGSDALTMLDERYAAGEITRTEYLRMRKDLTSGRSR